MARHRRPPIEHTSRWRRRSLIVPLGVAAAVAGLVGSNAIGVTPAPSTTNVKFVTISPAYKLVTGASIGAHKSANYTVAGAPTTVPDDATTVRVTVTAKGAASGVLNFYPAGNVNGGSGQTLSWPAGGTASTTIQENVGLKNQLTFAQASTKAVTVTATITGYSTQVTAGDISPADGSYGQVLTNIGSGAAWSDVGSAYSSATGFFDVALPIGVTTPIGTLAVPDGTFSVSATGTFQSASGYSNALCSLVAPDGSVAQTQLVVGVATGVNVEPIVLQGVITTLGGTITVRCLGVVGAPEGGNVNMTATQLGNATGAVSAAGTNTSSPKLSGNALPVK